MTTLVVSPHLDDAVLSLGQFLVQTPDVSVLTVLAGIPKPGLLSAYDANCGFGSSDEAVKERRQENARAMAVVDATPIDGGWLDGQYAEPIEHRSLVKGIAGFFGKAVERVLIPLGLHHPDHVAVAAAALAAVRSVNMPFAVYEELPYRVWFPREAVLKADALGFTLDQTPSGSLQAKRAAVECYRSQVGDDEMRRSLYVPERIWRRDG